MDPLMTPEDRLALTNKIAAKIKDMADDDLKALGEEIGVDEAIVATGDADKDASKALADSLMEKPVVDTGVLTGSRDGLKSFLMKKTRDKDSQA